MPYAGDKNIAIKTWEIYKVKLISLHKTVQKCKSENSAPLL